MEDEQLLPDLDELVSCFLRLLEKDATLVGDFGKYVKSIPDKLFYRKLKVFLSNVQSNQTDGKAIARKLSNRIEAFFLDKFALSYMEGDRYNYTEKMQGIPAENEFPRGVTYLTYNPNRS